MDLADQAHTLITLVPQPDKVTCQCLIGVNVMYSFTVHVWKTLCVFLPRLFHCPVGNSSISVVFDEEVKHFSSSQTLVSFCKIWILSPTADFICPSLN